MFKVYHFKKLKSTNDKAKEFREKSVIIADEQTCGKGRFERYWSSSKGGIYLSIVLLHIQKPQFYTFIASLSALRAVNSVLGVKTVIKWPNDLLYKCKKVCGILTENIIEKRSIIGIGINTNNKIPMGLEKKASSLKIISNKKIDNKKIINQLLKNFEKYYLILKNKKYSKIISDWKENSFLGSNVKIETWGKTYLGIAFDIDKGGFLVLRDKVGKKILIKEGDIFIN